MSVLLACRKSLPEHAFNVVLIFIQSVITYVLSYITTELPLNKLGPFLALDLSLHDNISSKHYDKQDGFKCNVVIVFFFVPWLEMLLDPLLKNV